MLQNKSINDKNQYFATGRSSLLRCHYLDRSRSGFLPQFLEDVSSPSTPSSYIVNGQVVRPHSHPYVAALTLGSKHFCGGSLVTPRHVITAAHCVAGLRYSQTKQLRVHLGRHDVFSDKDYGVVVRKVSEIYTHSNFKPSPHFWNDISVLRLKTDVAYR